MSELILRCVWTFIGGALLGSALTSVWLRWRRWRRRPKFTEFVKIKPWQRYWTHAELVEFLRTREGIAAAFMDMVSELVLIAKSPGSISHETLITIAERVPAFVRVSVEVLGDRDLGEFTRFDVKTKGSERNGKVSEGH